MKIIFDLNIDEIRENKTPYVMRNGGETNSLQRSRGRSFSIKFLLTKDNGIFMYSIWKSFSTFPNMWVQCGN